MYTKIKKPSKCFNFFFFCCDFCWDYNSDLHVYQHRFPPKVFFKFSDWCAWCEMVQPHCPNWCNILILIFVNLSHVLKMYFLDSVAMLYFLLLCFLSPSAVSSHIPVPKHPFWCFVEGHAEARKVKKTLLCLEFCLWLRHK